MKIFGAGIAGLMAGCAFQSAELFEAGEESQQAHKALLRFRSSAVGDFVGIPFRKVRVQKGIWSNGRFTEPNIQAANWYARKVVHTLGDRSITNVDPVERYVAPEDFISLLVDRCRSRIRWKTPIGAESLGSGEAVVSTLPMSLMVKFVGQYLGKPVESAPTFNYAPINVKRWRISGADVFQTIYFPDLDTPLYRASITKDLLIAEYVMKNPWMEQSDDLIDERMFAAFGLHSSDGQQIDVSSQRFGKIAPIDDNWRKSFIFNLTSKFQIFSLGRFGTWRNLLLDDVLHDIDVLKRLMAVGHYDRAKSMAQS